MALADGCDFFESENSNRCCGDYPDPSSSPYVLPYPVGQTYPLIQGVSSTAEP